MNDPQAEHVICAAIQDIAVTARELLDKRKILPALVLFYSGLDIFGSLMRPKANSETSGVDFKAWVDKYLLPVAGHAITSDDLWAGRCGLLHTNTPASRNSRRGLAQEIAYVRGVEPEAILFVQAELNSQQSNRLIVDIEVLFEAFWEAVMKFIKEIQMDATIRDLAFFHGKLMFSQFRYKLSVKSP
jgi:hypothetical protein